MRAVAACDATAFASVVETHSTPLYRIAYRMLGDAAEAEDIAQEALLRLWTMQRAGAGTGRALGPGFTAWRQICALTDCDAANLAVMKRCPNVPMKRPALTHKWMKTGCALQPSPQLVNCPNASAPPLCSPITKICRTQAAADALDMKIKAFESLLLRARHALKAMLEDRNLLPAMAGGD